jgi:hypothetical protein
LFVPKQAGTVIPNDMLAMAGGGQTVTQNFYINATDPMTFKQQLQREAAMIGNIGLQFTQAAANKRGKRGPLD